MKIVCIIVLMMFVSACSSHHVRCDGPLKPINAPAPVKAAKLKDRP